ncbi:hypothetical protein Tco_0412724 [Tanacetum coccineum]
MERICGDGNPAPADKDSSPLLVIVAVVWVVPRGGPIAVKTRSYGALALPEACLEICLEAWSLCFFACGVRWVKFPCFVILDFGSVLSVGSHGWRQSVDTKVGRSLISPYVMGFPIGSTMWALEARIDVAMAHSSWAWVKIDNPNITMVEYIRLEEEKARRRGKVYNWETAMYGKIWDNEDVHDLGSVETEFPTIVFNDTLTSEALLCEPTVSSLNNDEIDFRILFDESDDEDSTVIFDKNSFSHKIIFVNNLKTDLENDIDNVNMSLLPSPKHTVSYFDDLDFFKDFENEFPAIVYNDAQTSKSDSGRVNAEDDRTHHENRPGWVLCPSFLLPIAKSVSALIFKLAVTNHLFMFAFVLRRNGYELAWFNMRKPKQVNEGVRPLSDEDVDVAGAESEAGEVDSGLKRKRATSDDCAGTSRGRVMSAVFVRVVTIKSTEGGNPGGATRSRLPSNVEDTSDSSAPVTHAEQSPPHTNPLTTDDISRRDRETGPKAFDGMSLDQLMEKFNMVTAQQAALVAQLRASFSSERSQKTGVQKMKRFCIAERHSLCKMRMAEA